MLHNPVEDALSPSHPDAAAKVLDDGLSITVSGKMSNAAWSDFGDITARYDNTEILLSGMVGHISAAPPALAADYETAYSEFLAGNINSAGAAFLACACEEGPKIAALHGFACVLCALGAYDDAGRIATFLANLPGCSDPQMMAMAGYCAFKMRNAKDARVHLAKAARLARKNPEFRPVLKFAQRVLLMQQFGPGNPD